MSGYTRRRLIEAGFGAAAIGTLAGCTSTATDSENSNTPSEEADTAGPTAQSSFFVFGDFASEVAGEAATAETLVPIGQHGHGWEPGPQIQGTILKSDLFVYGIEGFQPWADDIVANLRDDEAEVDIIATGSSVDLTEGGHDHGSEDEHDHESEEEHDHEGEHDHGNEHDESLGGHALSHACGHMEDDETEPLVAVSSQEDAAVFSQTHQPYAVELSGETSYVTFNADGDPAGKYAFFTDSHETVHPIETSVVHESHSVESCDGIEEYYVVETEAGTVTIELTGDVGSVVTLLTESVSNDHSHTEAEGHDDHESEDDHGHESEDDHDHEGEEEHEEDGHGHNHGSGIDPHFWLDPQRAKQAVTTIEDGFAAVDDNNAEAYAENAESYRARLDDLDSSLESTISEAPKNTVFVAGHNAFQYLETRYGLQIETLTGLSPDDQPTPQDIERAQEIIAEHDLDYVCADPLESQTAAEQLVAETDATEVLPLTPIPGQTQDWADNDWGYVEVMENVNLETLETALDSA